MSHSHSPPELRRITPSHAREHALFRRGEISREELWSTLRECEQALLTSGGVPSTGSGFDPKRGKLINVVPVRRSPSRVRVEVIRYWPAPRMWLRDRIQCGDEGSRDSGWVAAAPRRGVHLRSYPAPTRTEHWRDERFLRSHHISLAQARIPRAVCEQVTRFGSRYHWDLLRLFWREPQLVERCAVQPHLCLLLALACRAGGSEPALDAARLSELATQSASRVLRSLGWAQPKSAYKVLQRLDLMRVRGADMQRIRRLLEVRNRWLQHLPALSREVLLMLEAPPVRLEFSLLQEVCELESGPDRRDVIRSLKSLKKLYVEGPVGRRPPPIRSRAHLQRVLEAEKTSSQNIQHRVDRALREARQVHRLANLASGGRLPRFDPAAALSGSALAPKLEWPEAPFDGGLAAELMGLTIRPITNLQQLTEHVRVQKNCLGTSSRYLGPVMTGEGAAYEVVDSRSESPRPARGTLYLERSPTGRWRVQEFKLTANMSPGRDLSKLVQDWLREETRRANES